MSGGNLRVRGVIWDVDGTLSNTHDLCVAGIAHAIESHGGPRLEPPEVVELFGPTEEGIFKAAIPEHADDAMETYVAFYERGHENGVEFADVTDLVHDLARAGVTQGVVTGKGARTAAITLRSLGVDTLLDPIVAGSESGSIKAEAMTSVVQRWGLEPDAVVYLGDVPSDVTHARAAGVVPVSVAWKPDADRPALEATDPAAIVSDAAALRTWLSTALDRVI